MTREKKKSIEEIVNNLKHLRKEGLFIMKNSSEVLRLREQLEKQELDNEKAG